MQEVRNRLLGPFLRDVGNGAPRPQRDLFLLQTGDLAVESARRLIQRQEGGSTTDESRHVRPSLNALVDLGVVTDDGEDSLTLASGSESEP